MRHGIFWLEAHLFLSRDYSSLPSRSSTTTKSFKKFFDISSLFFSLQTEECASGLEHKAAG